MSKLYLYAIFHANLNFSSVPEEFFPQILKNCYWPLLRIAEEQGIPLGFEFPAYTLAKIDSLDHSFIERLRALYDAGLCEVIGSGYVQSIMPLIPARVNRENLKLGNLTYMDLLGRHPELAYVNEQVYSRGLPELYKSEGYKAMVVNWESSLQSLIDPDKLYSPCKVMVNERESIPIIWHSTLAYRQFQKYAEEDAPLEDYLKDLNTHVSGTLNRAFPLYSSDWEVFDFKPWRAEPEEFCFQKLGDMDRISRLFTELKRQHQFEMILPSSVLSLVTELPTVKIENTSYPLTYKKQDLHSVSRWAVGGRDGVRLNTQCHQLYQDLLVIESERDKTRTSKEYDGEIARLWRDLCLLWNSDFRTFATEDKHYQFRNLMGAALYQSGSIKNSLRLSHDISNPERLDDLNLPSERSGLDDGISGQDPIGCSNSELIQQSNTVTSNKRPMYRIDTVGHIVETDEVRLELLQRYGGSIKSLTFPNISEKPLICQPNHLVPRSVWFLDNEFSGDVVIEDSQGRRITDHVSTDIQYTTCHEESDGFVTIQCSINTEIGTLWKRYRVYFDEPRVDLNIRFNIRDVVAKCFRLGRMILNPVAFDSSTLYYASTNGGDLCEYFSLKGGSVKHDEPLAGSGTGRGCLGATEGWVALGDAEKALAFITNQAGLYNIPLIHYEESPFDPKRYLSSVVFSLAEHDDTSHTLWRGHTTWDLSIVAGTGSIISQARGLSC